MAAFARKRLGQRMKCVSLAAKGVQRAAAADDAVQANGRVGHSGLRALLLGTLRFCNNMSLQQMQPL